MAIEAFCVQCMGNHNPKNHLDWTHRGWKPEHRITWHCRLPFAARVFGFFVITKNKKPVMIESLRIENVEQLACPFDIDSASQGPKGLIRFEQMFRSLTLFTMSRNDSIEMVGYGALTHWFIVLERA